MIDNFDLIRNFISFSDPDLFYFAQIMRRRKDPGNEKMTISDQVIKSYYIGNFDYFDSKSGEITRICNDFNARAYINLARRSYKDVALECLEELAKIARYGNYSAAGNCYTRSCGVSSMETFRLVDIDQNHLKDLDKIRELVEDVKVLEIPTVSGIHLLCKPFNPARLTNLFSDIDIHKNNPTLLYYNGDKFL